MMLRSPLHGFCALCVLFMGCSGIERTQAPPRPTRIGRTGSLSVQQVMRDADLPRESIYWWGAVFLTETPKVSRLMREHRAFFAY